jgi:DNA-binding MarR family transcriptional regulator
VADDPDLDQAATELRAVLAALYRRIRQTKELGELSGPESSALSRLSHQGAMTAAELAKLEQISPQSIANTLRGLLERGLVERRTARTEQLGQVLATLEPDERERLIAALPALARLAREL